MEMLLQIPDQSHEKNQGHTIPASTLPTINRLKGVGAELLADVGLILLEVASGMLEMGTCPQDLYCLFVFIFRHYGHMSSLTIESGY